jgi:hypothetical protein
MISMILKNSFKNQIVISKAEFSVKQLKIFSFAIL